MISPELGLIPNGETSTSASNRRATERGNVGRYPTSESEPNERTGADVKCVKSVRGHHAELRDRSHPLRAVRHAESRKLRGEDGVTFCEALQKWRRARCRHVAVEHDERRPAAQFVDHDIAGRERD